jgi:uncharacterized protein
LAATFLWPPPAGYVIVVEGCFGPPGPASGGECPVQETASKPECARDRHLFGPGPKRILSLDGGGVRGAISVAFLEQIEKVLTENLKKKVRLGDYFDLIGGTSTGAIISAALALGYTIQDIKAFYLELAPVVFRRSYWRVKGLRAKFDAAELRRQIKEALGDIKLGSEELVTGLCVVSKRMDTGSPWIMANNPRAPYWKTTAGQGGHTGNEHYSLGNIVRASTAAPFYFDPEWLPIVEGEPPGLFVDGGVTPHNNPSLMLFLMTILKAYQLCWQTGPEHLTVCSIGTGSSRERLVPEQLGMGGTAKIAIGALLSMMNDVQTFVVMQMQFLGLTLTPWVINSEVGTLAEDGPHNGKMFRYLRYDVRLELPWIEKELGPEVRKAFGRDLTELDVIRMRAMDDPTIIESIYKLATLAAEKQVKAEHWLGDVPDWCDGNAVSPAAMRRQELIRARAAAGPSPLPVPARVVANMLSKLRALLAKICNPYRR